MRVNSKNYLCEAVTKDSYERYSALRNRARRSNFIWSKVNLRVGAFVNNLLAGAIGGMVIVLNLGLGMNPALVGLLGALPRVTDAITDPLMGYLSDNTRSKWGRRRPYIFCGAIAAGLIFALLWQLPRGQSEMFYFYFFLAGSILFFLAYTVFATPWVALGYELTPDYHERTRLMGVQNFIGQLAYLLSPWFLWIMQYEIFDDMVDGAAGLGIAIGVATIAIGIMPCCIQAAQMSMLARTRSPLSQLARSPMPKVWAIFEVEMML